MHTFDIVLKNAQVITMDPGRPRAGWVAIRDGRIGHIGGAGSQGPERARLRVVDCKGATVVPGFTDPHMHLRSFAQSLVTLQVGPGSGVRSIEDIVDRVRSHCRDLAPGTWIRCAGYNEFYLLEKRHPSRRDLDRATTRHPVKLTHRTGHAHVLSSLALGLTGISLETPDPEGGYIERDPSTGEPTGLVYGMGDLLARRIPPLEIRELDQGVRMANGRILSLGITAIQDASARNDASRRQTFARWREEGLFTPEVSMMLGVEGFRQCCDRHETLGPAPGGPHPPAVKVVVHETTGRVHPPVSELCDLALRIHRTGLQAAFHAVEPACVEAACTAVEYALKRLPRRDHRHRIEHCSLCSPSLARRLAAAGIVVVTQPAFLFHHGDRYLQTVPAGQLDSLYPVASLLQSGVPVAGSSDCPIAPPDPLTGIYAAVTRKTETGRFVAVSEAVTPQQALRMFTSLAAFSAFQERERGSVETGKWADLVVLSADPTGVPFEEIRTIEVLMTICRGSVVWERGSTSVSENPFEATGGATWSRGGQGGDFFCNRPELGVKRP